MRAAAMWNCDTPGMYDITPGGIPTSYRHWTKCTLRNHEGCENEGIGGWGHTEAWRNGHSGMALLVAGHLWANTVYAHERVEG
eukprot:m.1660843 g.1660843  ORF g.1660843 m.1660843 type:complete len:83 (+) comp122935_c0_seq1:121-369(+)